MTEEMLNILVQCRENDVPVALVTIVSTRGSTPCKAGTRMLVFADGRTWGTIGGGCAESEAKLKALTALDQSHSCMVTISLFDGYAAEAGMVCGGTMDVFIQAVQ